MKQLSDKVVRLKEQILTEEATKNAFIMPFIQCLGYDIFNPLEVVPEFIADIGIKKGEKVDYAILKDGKPIILIECKWWGESLDPHNTQLFRYFTTTQAKFGLLSNGITYRFYTDLAEPNKMDEKPFFEFDITDIKDATVEELKKFHKSYFDLDQIVNTASELKYSGEIKTLMSNEIKNPSDSFTKYLVGQIYPGKAMEKVVKQFKEIIKKSLNQLISDMINETLKSAIDKKNQQEQEIKAKSQETAQENNKKPKVETTSLEIESFYIVRSILRTKIDANRITYRDTQSYLGILLDDNARKPICRLWLNGQKKYISTFDSNKTEIRHEISGLDDVFNFSEQLIQTVMNYDNPVKGCVKEENNI